MELRSPKVTHSHRRGTSYWYPYYTGYSEGFIEDVLNIYQVDSRSLILDPWNGSGTTTFVAHRLGYATVGFDLNPALVVVSKARLLDKGVIPSINSLTFDLYGHASRTSSCSSIDREDPLAIWFAPSTAAYIRSLERSIRQMLASPPCDAPPFFWPNASPLSTLACFYYVALFEAVRGMLKGFQSSNPTWTRLSQKSTQPVSLDRTCFENLYENAVRRLSAYISEYVIQPSRCSSEWHVEVAAAENLPVANNSVDFVLSSPPYCTRIDYAIMSYPELAILGCPADSRLDALRKRMLGTPTVSRLDAAPLVKCA
jgi:SAM-dependent methyltransferase